MMKMFYRSWICGLALLPGLVIEPAHGQTLVMSDDFESAGSVVNSTLWLYTSGTKVETGQNYFGATNRYFHVSGGGVKALSATLAGWVPITPGAIIELQDLGSVVVREAWFPVAATNGYYRSHYGD